MARRNSVNINPSFYKKIVDEKAEEDADRLAQGSMTRIGTDAANRAPVKTGHLRNTMTTGIRRSKDQKKGTWEMEQQTEYTLVQEYDHATNHHFISDSVDVEETRFNDAIKNRFRGGRHD